MLRAMPSPEPEPEPDARASLTAMISADPQRLRRRSISLGVPIDDADDVAQTVLLRAWRSVERLENVTPGGMCSWLDTIARNAAVDLARWRARREESPWEEAAPDPHSVAEEVETRVVFDGAVRALHDLPDTLREPLLLSAVDQLSAEEIAVRLGLSPAAVRQRISRARRALAGCQRSGMLTDDEIAS